MKYDLRRPCTKCPFRTDIRAYLCRARAREIVRALDRSDFPCHETVDYDDESDGVVTEKSQHCAGALIMLERVNRPSQMMRIMERLRFYDRTKLDMSAPVFRSPAAFIAAQGKR